MTSPERLLMWVFRLAVAAEFIGHGAFGWLRKPAWIPYFGFAGIEPDLADRLMPWVGAHDILLGILGLVSPRPIALAWMTFWGLWTALLRPLVGEPIWEAVERAGNVGVPLAFLLWAWPGTGWRDWLAPVRPRSLASGAPARLPACLRWTTALLLIGHGALGALCCKELLSGHLAALGWSTRPPGPSGWWLEPVRLVGALEIALGLLVLVRPLPVLLALAFGWKLLSESLFLPTGAPVWEFVERGGSYAAPLALLLLRAQYPLDRGRPPG